jgi:hypothetical protein
VPEDEGGDDGVVERSEDGDELRDYLIGEANQIAPKIRRSFDPRDTRGSRARSLKRIRRFGRRRAISFAAVRRPSMKRIAIAAA